MQLLATAAGMQALDRLAIGSSSVPGVVLMENAGRSFVESLAGALGPGGPRSALVLCGKGNNGGDGFVIARHLLNRGWRVHVALLAAPRSLTGDAALNHAALLGTARHAGRAFSRSVHRTAASLRKLHSADVLVDALFGTGFAGDVRGAALAAIRKVNAGRWYVASVDVPSGVNATTGTVGNLAVRADLTVTMGLVKTGLLLGAGREHAGRVVRADISIPAGLAKVRRDSALLVEAHDVRDALPGRPHDAHKYSVGKVYVLGGSRTLTGAPLMAGEAAMRAGAGAVVLGVPQSVHPAIARRAREVMIDPLPETFGGGVSRAALARIMERAAWADAVAVGPGLGRDAETAEVVRALLAAAVPLVIDADALGMLAGCGAMLRRRNGRTLLTPHAGEFCRLTGMRAAELEDDRVAAVRAWSTRLGAAILLKGSPTLTAEPRGHVWFNATGNPGMATAGAGDVLTGVAATLMAQGLPAAAAGWASAWLHGAAGDRAAAELGERSLMAGDIIGALPAVLLATAGR